MSLCLPCHVLLFTLICPALPCHFKNSQSVSYFVLFVSFAVSVLNTQSAGDVRGGQVHQDLEGERAEHAGERPCRHGSLVQRVPAAQAVLSWLSWLSFPPLVAAVGSTVCSK